MKKRIVAVCMMTCILLGGCGTKKSEIVPPDNIVSDAERSDETDASGTGQSGAAESEVQQAVSEENEALAETLAAHILDEDWQYVYDHLVSVDNAFIEPADIQYYFMSQLSAANGKSGKTSMKDQGYALAQTYMAVNAANFGGNAFDGKEVILEIKNDTADFYVGLLPDENAADGFVVCMSSADFWDYDVGVSENGYHGDFLIVPEAVTGVTIRGKEVSEEWRDDSIFQQAADAESLHNEVMSTDDTLDTTSAYYKAYRVVLPVTSLRFDQELSDQMMETYGFTLGEPSSLSATGTTVYGSCTSPAPEYEFLNDAESMLGLSVSAGGYTTDFVLDDNAQINEAMGTKLAGNITQILNTYHTNGTGDPDAFRPYFADNLTENADNWAAVISYIDELGDTDDFFNIAPDTAVRNISCLSASFSDSVHIEKGRWRGQIATEVQSDPSQYGQYYTEQDLEMRVGTNTTNDMAVVFRDGDPLITMVSRSFFKYMM